MTLSRLQLLLLLYSLFRSSMELATVKVRHGWMVLAVQENNNGFLRCSFCVERFCFGIYKYFLSARQCSCKFPV
jgi:hypothetical protein